ncbi:MAG: hypothetical protein F6K55_27235 [Moorea sp. SIO4A3]|nr:hypothetical protein [Moorena sp. SIO4A3]
MGSKHSAVSRQPSAVSRQPSAKVTQHYSNAYLLSAMQSASGGNHGSRSWFVRVRLWRGLRPSVAKGDSYRKIVEPCLDAKREWGKPRQLLMGETPKTALAPQDRAASLLTNI